MIGRITFLLGLAFSTCAVATNLPCAGVLAEATIIAKSSPAASASTKRRIAVITIGQTPRPDLVTPLISRLPQDVEVVEVGALDPLSTQQIDQLRSTRTPRYPLTTRLRDGSLVVLEEEILSPLVQAAVSRAEEGGTQTTMLLCAGGFNSVKASGTLIRPFDAAVEAARKHGAQRVAVVVPFEGQAAPSVLKWNSVGFEALSLVAAPGKIIFATSLRRQTYLCWTISAIPQKRSMFFDIRLQFRS